MQLFFQFQVQEETVELYSLGPGHADVDDTRDSEYQDDRGDDYEGVGEDLAAEGDGGGVVARVGTRLFGDRGVDLHARGRRHQRAQGLAQVRDRLFVQQESVEIKTSSITSTFFFAIVK